MKLLTINCYSGNTDAFITNNEGLFRLAEEDPRFDIKVAGPDGKNRYETYLKMLEESDSEYVLFADASTVISAEAARCLIAGLDDCDGDILSFKVNKEKVAPGTAPAGMIDKRICDPLYFPRYIFRRKCLADTGIGEKQEKYFEDVLLLKLLGSYRVVIVDQKIACVSEERLEENQAKYANAYETDWYAEYAEEILHTELKKGCPYGSQCLALYLIYLKYHSNQTIYDKCILDEEAFGSFQAAAGRALGHIERAVFSDTNVISTIGSEYSWYLYCLGRQGNVEVRIDENDNILIDGMRFADKAMQFIVYALNVEDGEFIIDAAITNNFIGITQEGRIAADVAGMEYPLTRTDIYSEVRAFGKTIIDRPTYQVRIPLKDVRNKGVRFVGIVHGNKIDIPVEFRKIASRLTNKSAYSYCRLNGYLLYYRQGKLFVQKGYKGWIRKELKFLRDIPRIRRSRKEALKAILLRVVYLLYRAFSSSRPKWIFVDKVYKGGDNGEHLFAYAYSNVDYADSYYIIRKDTADYSRLAAQYGGHILEYNSLRQKLLMLKADILFATHTNPFQFCGFGPTLQQCFRGELKAKVVCIQHGLTIQDIPQYQSRLVDNTRAYFCASEREIENLKQPAYGYSDDELLLTGLPRYDGLRNREKKQLLITPTWRRELTVLGNAAGDTKEYNPRFRESEYFRIYNELINNKKLLECAEKTGYSIMFLLHPTLGAQLKDFRAPDSVKLVNGATALYDDILAESSLMVTDYSGVQFDFAYMKKPVVYYHPEELPPQYESGHFSYEKDGFGPIISKQAELVDALCDYMKNGCVMEEKYSDRVGSFFRYTDDRNCERICAAVREQFYQ